MVMEDEAMATPRDSNDPNEQLKRDIEALRADVANLAETLKDIVERERASIRAQIHAAADKVSAQGEQLAHAAGEQISATTRQLEASIVRNPIQAILIALGLGFAIGILRR